MALAVHVPLSYGQPPKPSLALSQTKTVCDRDHHHTLKDSLCWRAHQIKLLHNFVGLLTLQFLSFDVTLWRSQLFTRSELCSILIAIMFSTLISSHQIVDLTRLHLLSSWSLRQQNYSSVILLPHASESRSSIRFASVIMIDALRCWRFNSMIKKFFWSDRSVIDVTNLNRIALRVRCDVTTS